MAALTDRRPEEVEQPQNGDLRQHSASVVEADPATEQEQTFRLTMRSAVSGDLLRAPGGGDFGLLEWDAKTTTVRQMREAVASAVLATWKAEGAERPRPKRLHWENITLSVAEVRRPPSSSNLSQPNPPVAQEDHAHQEAADHPEPTSRDSVGSFSSEGYLFDMDVLLEDDGGEALLCDALCAAHWAKEEQTDTGMANAGAAFEVKYFVRTFEPFATKNDAQKALALWVLEEGACRLIDGGPGLTWALAAQYSALQREQRDIAEKYGPVRIWDLSLLSDLCGLLLYCGDVAMNTGRFLKYRDLLQSVLRGQYQLRDLHKFFTADVSGWDVSGATNLSYMFHSCANFNSDISAWDVSKVENFKGMFTNCEKFDQDLAAWNVGNGRDFSDMFYGCHLFNRPLDPWDVAKAETMERMFCGCTKFNQPLASWQVGKARDFLEMFQQCAEFSQDLGSWKVSEEARVDRMFAGCGARFGPGLSPWSISDPKNQRARVSTDASDV